MAIYDCFQFFDEEHILDLRLNILNEFVDFFVFVESTTDHQGKPKKLNFDLKKFKELKRILSKQGIVIKRKPFSSINFKFEEFKSLYLTGIASFLIIMFSFIIPLSVDIDNQIASNNDSKINNSKKDFEKEMLADKERGYDVGTSLDTLGFQKDSLEIDHDFFVHMKEVYINKLYGDLYKYCDGIIEGALAIEEIPADTNREQVKSRKFRNMKRTIKTIGNKQINRNN